MKGLIVRARLSDVYLMWDHGWRDSSICRSDRGDDDAFNCIMSTGVEWKKRFHYCGMPLSEAVLSDARLVLFPVGRASEALAEWRATGLVRVLLLHEDEESCPWNLGPVWEGK